MSNKFKKMLELVDTELPVKSPTEKSSNEGFSNKNYVFNNCTVTINEEGKAIGILQEQEVRKAKTQEAQIKMIEKVIETISATVSLVVKSKSTSSSKSSPKKATLNKPTKK